MSNSTSILAYTPLAFATIGVIARALIKDRNKRLTPSIIFLAAMLLCWQVCLLLFNTSSSVAFSAFMYDFNLPFVNFSLVALLLFVLKFYSINMFDRPIIPILLCIIPCITLGLCVFHNQHEFIRKGLEVQSVYPMHIVAGTRAPWYYVHAFYSYALSMVSLGVALPI